jgi:hypothetical protein
MRKLTKWVVMGVGVASLLGTAAWKSDWLLAASAKASPSVRLPVLSPHLRSPARQALRESAYWIAQANQRASDEADASCQAIQEWDPAVSCDPAEARREQLAADPGGCMQRARRALARAEALAQTPQERHRVVATRAALAAAAEPGLRGAMPGRGDD